MRSSIIAASIGISFQCNQTLGDEIDYQRRLANLKESQNQTQVLLNRLGGFSTRSGQSSTNLNGEIDRSPLFRIHGDLKANRIRTGSVLSGHTLNKLVIGGETAPAIIQFEDQQGNLSGLKVLATARPSATDGRVHLDISRVVLHSGRVVTVNAVGLDMTGAQGIAAQVFSSKALAVAGSIATSFVAGVAAAKQTQNTNVFGFTQNQTTGRNAILGGIAQTAADQSKRLIEEATTEKPVLVLDANTPIRVFFPDEVKF